MSNTIKQRCEISEEYKWDLSTLFKSYDEFETKLNDVDTFVEVLSSYKGKLNNPETIREFMDKETEIDRKVDNLITYAMLRRSEDTTNEKAQAMYGKAMSKMSKIMAASAYVQPELLSLSKETLESLLNNDILKDYKFNIEKLILKKDHTLTTKEEELLANFSEVLNGASEISSNLMDADMVFDPVEDKDGNKIELSGSNYILLQSSDDRVLRENAFKSFYKTYRLHNNTLATTYTKAVKNATTQARVRKYNSSREMVMSNSNIPLEVYENLVSTVHKHMNTMHRYVSLRKRLLKVDELHYYDVYAPLVSNIEKKYSYENAQNLILDALKPLGKDYTDVVKGAFKDRWIDVMPSKGKRGGAFSSGTYDSNPYILTSFTGTLDSVSTIAHEMGHSMHSYLSHKTQKPQYANYTLFVAEVASTVNENLLIEKQLSEEKDPMNRLSLLNQYLENFKGTVYRQTMFAEFEKKAHELVENNEALTPSVLNNLYLNLIKDYFGDDLVIDDEVKYEWSRIPHFYRPFYVYVYATGYSSAVAISEKILKEGDSARDKYLEFLSMGGSKYPLDELKHASVDLRMPEPIDTALNKFKAVLDEAEKIADELGL